MRYLRLVFFSMVLLFFSDCSKKELPIVVDSIVNGQRIIYFAGYYWLVGTSLDATQAPGPNYFSNSAENVWLDAAGALHLRITQRNNKWYCATVTMLKSYGHGRYLFYLDSRMDNLDKNVVCGLFTYKSDTEEIDIEFAKWGKESNNNCQFSVQPSNLSGNTKSFNFSQSTSQSTHWFDWQSNHIDFASADGHSSGSPSVANVTQQWSYAGANIPPDSNETLSLNLWLFLGVPPSDLKEVEVVVSGLTIS